MRGIKRGPLWFINRLEALRWAHEVSVWESHRWQLHTDRLGRMIKREERGTRPPKPEPTRRYQYSAPPEGLRVCTIEEAAALLEITTATVRLYLAPSGPLRDVQRYRLADRTLVVAADGVDAYKERRAQPGRGDRRLRQNRLAVVRDEVA
jgi:hypothetical protein